MAIIFLPCGFFLSSIFFYFFSSPNLSGGRLGACQFTQPMSIADACLRTSAAGGWQL